MTNLRIGSRTFMAFLFLSRSVLAFSIQPSGTEKEWRLDANQHIAKAVKILNHAAKAYATQGPEAFIEALPQTLSSSSRQSVMKGLGKLAPFPHFALKGSQLLIVDAGRTYSLDTLDVARGNYSIDGQTYHYNIHRDMSENLSAWEGNQVSQLFNWSEKLLPSAHASGPSALLFMGVALMGWLLGSVVVPKISSWLNPATEPASQASNHSTVPPNGSASPAPTVSTTPTPVTTPTGATGAAATLVPGAAPAPVRRLDPLNKDQKQRLINLLCSQSSPSEFANSLLAAVKLNKDKKLEFTSNLTTEQSFSNVARDLIITSYGFIGCKENANSCDSLEILLNDGSTVRLKNKIKITGDSVTINSAESVELIVDGKALPLCPAGATPTT